MNSIYAVEKGLPPGLWLPTAEESTDQYLKENFNHPYHEYESIVDYASFVVALAFLTAEEKDRISLMPSTQDFTEMFEAGYGISPNSYLKVAYGGVRRVQRALGFFPEGYEPSKEELTERLQWIATYAHPREHDTDKNEDRSFHEIIKWGSARNLSPAPRTIYRIFCGDTSPLRRAVGLEKRNNPRQLSHVDLYRFGATVIRENGCPLNSEKLNEKYAGTFIGSPYETIRTIFGSATKFWLEFGYIPKHNGLNADDIRNLGVRWAIQHDGEILHTGQIRALSRLRQFPSKQPIQKHFGSISAYRATLAEGYKEYLELEEKLVEFGVSEEIIKLMSRKFEVGETFARHLTSNLDILLALSNTSETVEYVTRLMKCGLDLESELVFDMQAEDLLKALRKLGIRSKRSMRFVLEAIPLLYPPDILGRKHTVS